MRAHNSIVPCHNIVWSQGGIPRQNFILWLAAHQRLSTHDRIINLTPGPLACTLCHSQMETHDHLFFACAYSTYVWQDLMQRCDMVWNRHNWSDTLLWMGQHLKGKKAHHVIPKMCLGVAVYGLWRERNNRTFKLRCCPREHILQTLISQINALISLKWKHHRHLGTLLSKWS